MYTPVDNTPFLDFIAGRTGELQRLQRANTLLWVSLGVTVTITLLVFVHIKQQAKEEKH
ncbi:hypothetical protein [Flavisolibacter nicotianae]|uniref:hypothetical protein n=1 Tax=Flavisolibacter nicotianae TaxID=2364882 RepID=UPI0013C477C6|nr:hypothetical protein [Flavisolibacter nicotianae]